jgi:hypothetical protein
MRVPSIAILVLSAAVLAACGGSSNEPREPAGTATPAAARPAGEGEAAGATAADDKLRAAQASAVHAVCERLVDQCAVEDAKKNLSPAEAAKNTEPGVLAIARHECEGELGRTALSPRQIKVFQRCVNEAAECDALQTCLAEAQKR